MTGSGNSSAPPAELNPDNYPGLLIIELILPIPLCFPLCFRPNPPTPHTLCIIVCTLPRSLKWVNSISSHISLAITSIVGYGRWGRWGMASLRRGTKGGGSAFFCQKGRKGDLFFFSEGGKYIDILGNFKHFEAQKMLKCFKIAPNSLLGLF
jgi:hypothetical protein